MPSVTHSIHASDGLPSFATQHCLFSWLACSIADCSTAVQLGLARTICIRCVYGIFGRDIIKYTVNIYGVYIYGFGQPYTSRRPALWLEGQQNFHAWISHNKSQNVCSNLGSVLQLTPVQSQHPHGMLTLGSRACYVVLKKPLYITVTSH